MDTPFLMEHKKANVNLCKGLANKKLLTKVKYFWAGFKVILPIYFVYDKSSAQSNRNKAIKPFFYARIA